MKLRYENLITLSQRIFVGNGDIYLSEMLINLLKTFPLYQKNKQN